MKILKYIAFILGVIVITSCSKEYETISPLGETPQKSCPDPTACGPICGFQRSNPDEADLNLVMVKEIPFVTSVTIRYKTLYTISFNDIIWDYKEVPLATVQTIDGESYYATYLNIKHMRQPEIVLHTKVSSLSGSKKFILSQNEVVKQALNGNAETIMITPILYRNYIFVRPDLDPYSLDANVETYDDMRYDYSMENNAYRVEHENRSLFHYYKL